VHQRPSVSTRQCSYQSHQTGSKSNFLLGPKPEPQWQDAAVAVVVDVVVIIIIIQYKRRFFLFIIGMILLIIYYMRLSSSTLVVYHTGDTLIA